MSQRIEKRVQVYIDSGHIHNRRSTSDFDYILDEPIVLADDEGVSVKLTFLSMRYDFAESHKKFRVDATNDAVIYKHGNWANAAFPFILTTQVDLTTPVTPRIETINIPHKSYHIDELLQFVKTEIEKKMTYYSFLFQGPPPRDDTIYDQDDLFNGTGNDHIEITQKNDIQTTLGGSPFRVDNIFIDHNVINYNYELSGVTAAWTPSQIKTIYQLMYNALFKTEVTLSLDENSRLSISVAPVDPDSNWARDKGLYPFLRAFDFRTLVLLPGSTLFTSLGFSAEDLDTTADSEVLDLEHYEAFDISHKFFKPPTTDTHNYFVGDDIVETYTETVVTTQVTGHGVRDDVDPWHAREPFTTTREAFDSTIVYEPRAIHVRTNLTHRDMIDSYHGRYTNSLVVIPIRAAAGEMIYSTPEEVMVTESSIITRPTIEQISVTLVDEHGVILDTGSDVNVVFQFQFYKIPVLHKPIQDVRDRLRYFKEKVRQINKPRNSIKNGNKKKRKNKKKKGGEAKAKPGTAGDRLRPRTAAAKEAEAQP